MKVILLEREGLFIPQFVCNSDYQQEGSFPFRSKYSFTENNRHKLGKLNTNINCILNKSEKRQISPFIVVDWRAGVKLECNVFLQNQITDMSHQSNLQPTEILR